MKTLIAVAALLAAAAPALAQDAAAEAGSAMTCGEFLALSPEQQMQAMLTLRAATNGEPAPAADAEPSESDAHRLTGMRTSCEGVPDVMAADAMVAAHADYE